MMSVPIYKSLNGGWIKHLPLFLSPKECTALLTHLQSLDFYQNTINVFGKTHKVPREELLLTAKKQSYTYSGNTLQTNPFTPSIEKIKHKVECFSKHEFNCVLINHYRDGRDGVGWHSDDEKELGVNPTIASLSVGATRNFDLKHKQTGERLRIPLQNGDLLIMGGALQQHWKHQVPKTKQKVGSRFNLTWRNLVSS